METSWADLPSQISISREQAGWRVHSFPPGSLFADADLQPGDLIPDGAIEAMKYSNPEGTHLAERVTAILNHAVQR